MKISEVIQLTGLTKKAINYYEEQELIAPNVLDENNYRDYSNSDVERLIQIAALRQMDVAIKDIREILLSPIKLEQILKNHLMKLDDNIKAMEKSRDTLKSCLYDLTNKPIEISNITKNLLRLRKSLDLDEKNREGYIKKQLQILFPGKFGKGIIAHFEPFLNEPIDTAIKENAWFEMVKFLDEVENLEYPTELDEMYNGMSEEDLNKVKQVSKDMSQYTPEKLKEIVLEGIKRIDESSYLQAQIKSLQKSEKVVKNKLREIGFYEKFNKNLEILSNDYRKSQENLRELNKLVSVELDDEGNILIEKFR